MQPIFINFMKIIDFFNQVHYISFTANHTKQIILLCIFYLLIFLITKIFILLNIIYPFIN